MKDVILSVLRRKRDVPAGKIVSSGPKPLSVEADVLIKLKSSKKKKKKQFYPDKTFRFYPPRKSGRCTIAREKPKKQKKKNYNFQNDSRMFSFYYGVFFLEKNIDFYSILIRKYAKVSSI